MKFGLRIPSLKKRLSARLSFKRAVAHRLKIKAPRGFGIFTNPKKAVYNKIYNKTSVSVDGLFKGSKSKNTKTGGGGIFGFIWAIIKLIFTFYVILFQSIWALIEMGFKAVKWLWNKRKTKTAIEPVIEQKEV